MFKFLKSKIKDTVGKFQSKAEEESETIDDSQLTPQQQEQLEQETKQLSAQDLLDEASLDKSINENSQTIPDEELSDSQTTAVQQAQELLSDIASEDETPDVVADDSVTTNTTDDQKGDSDSLSSSNKEEIFDGPEPLIEEEIQTQSQSNVSTDTSVESTLGVNKKFDSDLDVSNSDLDSDSEPDTEKKSDAVVDADTSVTNVVDSDTVVDSDSIDDSSQQKKKGFFKKIFSSRSKDGVETDEQSTDSSNESSQSLTEEIPNKEDLIQAEVELQSELAQEGVLKSSDSHSPQPKDSQKSTTQDSEETAESKSQPSSKEDSALQDSVSQDLSQTTHKAVAHEDLFESDVKDTTKKKKGLFKKLRERVVKFQLTEESFEELFWEFELSLLENNVAVEVIEKIKKDLHDQLTQENVSRRGIEEVILDTLKSSLDEILDVETFDLVKKTNEKKPFVISLIGVNGSGKTTTLAKIIKLLQKNNKSVVVAASDTFRAAAIQQLQQHTDALGVKLIKHDYHSDPSAVAFDAIKHAESKQIDVVLIDTAGRLQSNSNLMDELKKLIRVNKPDLNIFIGESITGNDCVEQAVAFNEAVGIDGIILSKADVDDKGGAAISASYVTKKPILYLGVGQSYGDLKPFDKDFLLKNLGL